MDYQKLLPCIHVHAVFNLHGRCNKGFDTMCAPKKLQYMYICDDFVKNFLGTEIELKPKTQII